MHGALYKERGPLISGEKEIKNREEILALFEAIWLPKKVAVIHCLEHQTSGSKVSRGNALADQTAKEAARKPVGPINVLLALPLRVLTDSPVYTQEEVKLYSKLGGKERSSRWVELLDGRIFIPEALGRDLILQIYQGTHLGGTKLIELLKRDYYIPKLQQIAKRATSWCHTCT